MKRELYKGHSLYFSTFFMGWYAERKGHRVAEADTLTEIKQIIDNRIREEIKS